MAPLSTALVSVFDKTGLETLGRRLAASGMAIISSGGTARALEAAGVPVTEVSDVTGSPEMMDGRVKTLHPTIHGGILADRSNESHLVALRDHDITPIDMVVVTLYPFEEVVTDPASDEARIIEHIDIGGPTMIRAAAKNHRHVVVIVDPDDAAPVLDELDTTGEVSLTTRRRLAAKAFARTAAYDTAITSYLGGDASRAATDDLPEVLTIGYRKAATLRYGENPHQRGALYAPFPPHQGLLDQLVVHQGKALSYNNIADMEAAFALVSDFDVPAAVIVKHANPCGVGLDRDSLRAAYDKALATDPTSAFGGIVAFNRQVDAALASTLKGIFLEVVAAPGYSDEALAVFRKKKNLRVLTIPVEAEEARLTFRPVRGGLLVQDVDTAREDVRTAEVVTRRAPSDDELAALALGWTVVRVVKSNAIVLARHDRTVGIGAGQMSRVDATEIAMLKATQADLPLQGAVIASDAFFPFADSIEAAHARGITAAIQPGGSIRDAEVVARADELGMAMLFTGVRHFRHV